jgi:hypothetical protein
LNTEWVEAWLKQNNYANVALNMTRKNISDINGCGNAHVENGTT